MSADWWRGPPGLAGGIDKDGGRAAELLALGFGGVEFGSVAARAEPGIQPGAAALAARLAALPARTGAASRIGIGLGMHGAAPASALADEWLAGMDAVWGAADYLSFNLSARARQPLLTDAHLALLRAAFEAVAAEHRRRLAASGMAPRLTLKLALETARELPLTLAEAAIGAGFDAITAVLPACPARLDRLRALAVRLDGKAALLAVGGIRDGAGLRAALAAGADWVQVHTLFTERGPACLAALLDGGHTPAPPLKQAAR